jgi:V8-like Glu-specific endopeptidase
VAIVPARTWLCLVLVAAATSAAAQTAAPSASPGCVTPDRELLGQFEAARAALPPSMQTKPIYGCDDRKDLFDPRVTEHQKRAAQATAVLVLSKDLRASGSGFVLPADRAGLCSPEQAAKAQAAAPERFWDQPSPGFCSGFKVGPRLIATAGHCIKTQSDCRGTSFVFGFQMSARNSRPEQAIAKGNVYRCTAMIGGSHPAGETSTKSDWRVVRVDREIDAPTVAIRTAADQPPLKPDSAVTVIGYPIGLPVKIADNATVRTVQKTKFVANLDTYGGNSGSVVLNTDRLARGDLLAEGILVSGEPDFQTTNQACFLSKRCPNAGCAGETVTAISEIAAALKK